MRALRENLGKKIHGDEVMHGQMINVTMKSTQAAEKANELTLVALDRHFEQTKIVNAQRKRELLQTQARLYLDSETARATLQLRRDELESGRAHHAGKDHQIDELKSSVASVQGTLSDMESLLKLLADQMPGSQSTS